jgi:hypothetical protein
MKKKEEHSRRTLAALPVSATRRKRTAHVESAAMLKRQNLEREAAVVVERAVGWMEREATVVVERAVGWMESEGARVRMRVHAMHQAEPSTANAGSRGGRRGFGGLALCGCVLGVRVRRAPPPLEAE